jgi:hypothetical protein
MPAGMAASVSGKTASLVDVGSSTGRDMNQRVALVSHDVFAIMQLEGKLPPRYLPAYGIFQNARFLEQLAARSVLKTFSGLQGAPGVAQ